MFTSRSKAILEATNKMKAYEDSNTSTSSAEPNASKPIVCFEYAGHKCFSLSSPPERCPNTGKRLKSIKDFDIAPFRLPSPFAPAPDFPCSVVIRPTRGDFLEDYAPGDNLHIGVTASDGRIAEFDARGLRVRSDARRGRWRRSVVLNFKSTREFDPRLVLDPDWDEYWDSVLQAELDSGKWAAERYEERERNCFTFVLEFLAALRTAPFSRMGAMDKVTFCEAFVLPKTTVASKYIRLHRRLVAEADDSEGGEGVISVKVERGSEKSSASLESL